MIKTQRFLPPNITPSEMNDKHGRFSTALVWFLKTLTGVSGSDNGVWTHLGRGPDVRTIVLNLQISRSGLGAGTCIDNKYESGN